MSRSRFSMRRMSRFRHRAFALIELLVVIGILALLAALLFPAFASAREKSRQSACSNDMRQLGMAQMNYVEDYDGMMQAAYSGVPNVIAPWPDLLYPYAKNSDIYNCPDSKAPWEYASTSLKKTLSLSYIPNYGYSPPGNVAPQSISEVKDPTNLVAYAEMRDLEDWPGWTGAWGIMPWPNVYAPVLRRLTYEEAMQGYQSALAGETPSGNGKNFAPRLAFDRHGGGSNYVFADGHARWLRFMRTIDPDGSRTTDHWMWMQRDFDYAPNG